VPLTHSVIDII